MQIALTGDVMLGRMVDQTVIENIEEISWRCSVRSLSLVIRPMRQSKSLCEGVKEIIIH